MKLYLATVTLPALASGYSMGVYNMFGRPVIISRGQDSGCSPQQAAQSRQQQQEFVDRAFESLASELNDATTTRSTTNRGPRRQVAMRNEESIRQQKEWLNRAFGLATEVASGVASSPTEAKESKEVIGEQAAQIRQKQKEFVDRAFESLASELNDATTTRSSTNRGPRRQVTMMNEDSIRQQKEWLDRALALLQKLHLV
jgi:hypothetical protein